MVERQRERSFSHCSGEVLTVFRYIVVVSALLKISLACEQCIKSSWGESIWASGIARCPVEPKLRPLRPLFVMRVLLMQKWVLVMPPFFQDIVLHSASLSARMFCFWWFCLSFWGGGGGSTGHLCPCRISLPCMRAPHCFVANACCHTTHCNHGWQCGLSGLCQPGTHTPMHPQSFSHFKLSTSFCCAFLSCFHTHTHLKFLWWKGGENQQERSGPWLEQSTSFRMHGSYRDVR